MNFVALSTLSTYEDLQAAFVHVVARLGSLRDTLPYPPHDARHVALGGMQRIVAGFGMGLNSMVFGRTAAQVLASLGTTNLSGDEMRKLVEDAWRWGVSTLFHFRIDSLFSNLLSAAGRSPSPQFRQKAEALLLLSQLTDPSDALERLLALAYIRNSHHNNGIHRNAPLAVSLGGIRFHFLKDQAVQCASWAHIFVVMDAVLDVLDGLLHAPAISALPHPIRDAYAEALADGRAQA